MNRFPESTTKSASGRRRLLRATMSAPVVLTVYSGSAMAGASTRCLANAVAIPTTQPVITAGSPAAAQSTDAFVRVRLFVDASSSPSKYWVRGGDLGSSVSIAGGPSTLAFREFQIAGNTFVGTAQGSMPAGATPSDRYAAVRYDATGTVVGVGASSTSGSAITQSCWQSFPSP